VVGARAVIAGLGTAFPPSMSQAELWEGYFEAFTDGSRVARRAFATAGVSTRHGVVNPLVEEVSGWSTEKRLQRYQIEARPLGRKAVAAALAEAGLDAADVGLLTVVSCTGYATPGLDMYVARDLGMPADLQRLVVGHMGCYAALPGLQAVSTYVATHHRPAVLLCLELTSLHLQPPTADLDQVISHSLFSDAAAAVVLVPDGTGLEVREVSAMTDAESLSHMSWHVTDVGFRMGISPKVPDVLAHHLHPTVTGLLARHDRKIESVTAWGVHPGGPRILDVVERELGLGPEALAASRTVLTEHGNCSSATVLLVLEELRRRGLPAGDDLAVLMAFGPGLTLYAALVIPC
jgi:alkylresorcinol/alkylpyrone synthase